jgi:hypothetical protein
MQPGDRVGKRWGGSWSRECSAVVAAAMVLGTAASAETFVDTFDDPALPGWGLDVDANHMLSVIRGKVVMTKNAGQPGGSAFMTLCGKRLVGDFTATVKATRQTAGSAGIVVSFAGPPGGFADVFFAGTTSINAVMCSAGCTSGVSPTGASSVQFELTRSGSTMTMSYDAGAGSVIVHTITAPELAGPMTLSLFQLDEFTSGAAYSVTYDDLVIEGTLAATSTDLDGDGAVDGADLGLLLSAWGECPLGCCDADLNGDGEIDGADLGLLLGSWTG